MDSRSLVELNRRTWFDSLAAASQKQTSTLSLNTLQTKALTEFCSVSNLINDVLIL